MFQACAGSKRYSKIQQAFLNHQIKVSKPNLVKWQKNQMYLSFHRFNEIKYLNVLNNLSKKLITSLQLLKSREKKET